MEACDLHMTMTVHSQGIGEKGSCKRKAHKKSRRGCRNCKLRSVKVSRASMSFCEVKLLIFSSSVMRPSRIARNARLSEFPVIMIPRLRICRCALMEQQ